MERSAAPVSVLLLKKRYWPLMNADERGFKQAKHLFSICVYRRSSAANPAFFSGLARRQTK
jgi:hypothetical protein